MKFQNIFIRRSKIFQEVIKSEPEVRIISFNIIFRFHNILMSICWHKFIFVSHAMQKRFFFFLQFFSSKSKNHPTSERATAPYFWNFCKIWVSMNISMLRRVRTTRRRTPYVHTEGTKIANVRHKNRDFSCILAMSYHSQKPIKIAIFSKIFFAKKYVKNPFEWSL